MDRKILIIDDDERFALPLKSECLARGYVVEWLNDPTQALERIKGMAPDVVVLDVMMPGEHGIAVLDRILSDKKTEQIPVVVASNLEHARELVAPKVRAFWSKNDMTLAMMGDEIAKILASHGSQ